MEVVYLSVAITSMVIMLLVLVIVLAEKKLSPGGEAVITINGKDQLKVKPGTTLLNVLAAQKVFLPSACGGGGTCAMCKCQVPEGGGDILPTETTHINRKEAKENWRLACQVKVKQDMSINVPDEVFSIKKYDGVVTSNENVATFIKELCVDLPKGTNLDYKAGGYMQLDIPAYGKLPFKDFKVEKEYHPDWDKFNVWGLNGVNDEECFRAYSMASYPAEGDLVKFNIRIATPPPPLWNEAPPGIASSYVFSLKPGDKLTLSGPYGEFFAKDTDREMCFIGGGAGMAPMRSHIYDQFFTKKTKRKVTFWYGARSLREMFYDDEFKKIQAENPNFSYHVALSEPMEEDKWTGPVGFIHQVLLDEFLSKHEDPTEIEYYLCGPPPMIDAVQKMLDDLGVEPEMIAFDAF